MISVLMSIYNEKIEWIEQAINSILNQTYQNLEYIIIIDNPNLPDNIVEYLEFKAQNDERIILIYNIENLGLAKSLNTGLQMARGKYIARMDADDISMPNRLEKELDYIKFHNADMISCQRIEIDEHGNEIGKEIHLSKNPNKELPFSNFIVHPGVLIKKSVIQKLGGYRNFRKSQDYDLWLRLVSNGYKIRVMPDCLLKYRIRKNSVSYANMLEQYYISEYQKKLYFQREKYGKDQFTEQNLNNYLDRKKITHQKIEKYLRARRETNMAIQKYKQRRISFIIHFVLAIYTMPEIPLKSAKAVICMRFIDKLDYFRKINIWI